MVAKQLSEEFVVEGKAKAEVKAVLLQALADRDMLKGTAKPFEMCQMQFQVEMKKLEMQEEKQKDKEKTEKERKRRKRKEEKRNNMRET